MKRLSETPFNAGHVRVLVLREAAAQFKDSGASSSEIAAWCVAREAELLGHKLPPPAREWQAER